MNFIFQFLFNNPTCETEHPHSSRLLSCCIHGPLRLCSGSMNLMIHMFNDRNCIRNNNLLHPWPSPFMFRLNEFDLMILKRPGSTIEIVFVIITCWSQGWTELSVPRSMCLISSQFHFPLEPIPNYQKSPPLLVLVVGETSLYLRSEHNVKYVLVEILYVGAFRLSQ